MVREDRSTFRKWEKEGWKEKVGDAEGDRKGDKTAALLSRGAASLLGLPDLTQSRVSQDGIHQRCRYLIQRRHTHTNMHKHSRFRNKEERNRQVGAPVVSYLF